MRGRVLCGEVHIQWDAVPSEHPGIAITAAGHHSPTQKGQRKGEKAQEDGGGGESASEEQHRDLSFCCVGFGTCSFQIHGGTHVLRGSKHTASSVLTWFVPPHVQGRVVEDSHGAPGSSLRQASPRCHRRFLARRKTHAVVDKNFIRVRGEPARFVEETHINFSFTGNKTQFPCSSQNTGFFCTKCTIFFFLLTI